MFDLFVVVPHPDDETLYCGGLISATVNAGKTVAILTLTRGGAGRTLGMCQQKELPAVREAELRAALGVLGVADAEILDLPDGLLIQHREEIIKTIALSVRRLEPKVIVCFPPNGINGHPDHVTTSQAVTSAMATFSASPSLYFVAMEQPFNGSERAGYLSRVDIQRMHRPPTHLVMPSDGGMTKLRAMGCHETQARSVARFLREYPDGVLIERFHRARPESTTRGPTRVSLLT